MGVPRTQFLQINFNGHEVICAVTKNTRCGDVIKMAAVQTAQNVTNVEMFVHHEGMEKKIAKNLKLLKIVRSFGVGSTNYTLVVRPVEKNDSKSNLAVTACKALKKLLILKNFLVKKQTEATDITSNNTIYANLNNTANTKDSVDDKNKSLNALLHNSQHSTTAPCIGDLATVSEYETTIMTRAGHSGFQSRSVLNKAFVRDRWTDMNRAFIESLMDSVYANDDTVQDVFNHCRYVDEDEDVAADGFKSATDIVASTIAEDTTAFMSDSSEDESLDELEMNIDDDILKMDVDLYDEGESLTRDVNTSLVLSWVNLLNLGYHEQFTMTDMIKP